MEQTNTCTGFAEVKSRFLKLIEKDRDFFSYYNLSVSEIEAVVEEQTNGYLIDAIDKLTSKCNPDVDFYDYDEELEQFNFQLTKDEVGLLASLMYEVYFERDEVLLKAYKVRLTPTDLNQFSPANERKTFMDMLAEIKLENLNAIKKYDSTVRGTGKRKTIDHSKYEY